MLNFSHSQSRSIPQQPQVNYDREYGPIQIKNTGKGKQNLMPAPVRANKQAVNIGNVKKSAEKEKRNTSVENKQWNSQGFNTVTFDKKIKKDSLAAEERQINAMIRIKENQRKRGITDEDRILTKEEQFQKDKMNMLTKEQTKELEILKKNIQKERLEKQKKDQEYEQKRKRLQKEQQQLINLQKQMQKRGPEVKQAVRQKLKQYKHGEKSVQKVKQRHFPEITQSEMIANQRNRTRDQQLQYLIDQRSKHNQFYERKALGYNPTLIPLISRASYKIISTEISNIVELIIDQQLQQQVHLLNSIQEKNNQIKKKQEQKQMMKEYAKKVEDFFQDVSSIQNKIGSYKNMRFQDLPHSKMPQIMGPSFEHRDTNKLVMLELNMTNDQQQDLFRRVKKFKQRVNYLDYYSPAHLQTYSKLTEQLIDSLVGSLAKQLDSGAAEFVNIVFRSEFQ